MREEEREIILFSSLLKIEILFFIIKKFKTYFFNNYKCSKKSKQCRFKIVKEKFLIEVDGSTKMTIL